MWRRYVSHDSQPCKRVRNTSALETVTFIDSLKLQFSKTSLPNRPTADGVVVDIP